jgi:E3 ubiquitin ligase
VDFRFSIGAAAAIAGGLWCFVQGLRAMRIVRLIENTPTARIRSMAMGLVEVRGRPQVRSALTAPFSGHPCAYWEVDISTRGKNNSYTVIHRNSSGNPFFLIDETGSALVYPQGAQCRIRYGTEEECFGLQPPSPYAEYLHQHNSFLTATARLSTLRFRERTIEDGMELFVMGTAEPRANAISVSEATGTDDDVGSGALVRHQLDHDHVAVIRKGENEGTFIISQESQRDLTTVMRLKAFAMVFGGPLLALAGLGYWLLLLSTRGHAG